MEARGWYTANLHGNRYQKGLPDIYGCHVQYGARFVEVKRPDKWAFTEHQKREFPKIMACGIGIWILTGVNDYYLLFDPCNLRDFMPETKPVSKIELIRQLRAGKVK